MDIDTDTLGIPDTEYDASVTMPSSEFSRIVRDLSQLGESVRIEVSKEGVRFASEGEAANGSVLLKGTEGAESGKMKVKKEEGDDNEDEEQEEEEEEEDGGKKKTIKKEKVKKEKSNEDGEDVEMDDDEGEFKADDEDGEEEQDGDDNEDGSGKKRKRNAQVSPSDRHRAPF